MKELLRIGLDHPDYPPQLRDLPEAYRPAEITAMGNPALLHARTIALLCSQSCPGDLASQAYDVAQSLRDLGAIVASGFHSPMEKTCLQVLLASPHPVVVAMARSLSKAPKLPSEYRRPMEEGRLLVLSCFEPDIDRVTRETAARRNLFVATLAAKIFVAHAQEGGSSISLCRKVIDWGKPLYTLAAPRNEAVIDLGAIPLQPGEARTHLA